MLDADIGTWSMFPTSPRICDGRILLKNFTLPNLNSPLPNFHSDYAQVFTDYDEVNNHFTDYDILKSISYFGLEPHIQITNQQLYHNASQNLVITLKSFMDIGNDWDLHIRIQIADLRNW